MVQPEEVKTDTPLYFAVRKNQIAVATFLLERGATRSGTATTW